MASDWRCRAQDSPLFSSTKTTKAKVRLFRVQFDLNLTLSMPSKECFTIFFRDAEFFRRRNDLQNLEFVDMQNFLVCLHKLA